MFSVGGTTISVVCSPSSKVSISSTSSAYTGGMGKARKNANTNLNSTISYDFPPHLSTTTVATATAIH